MSKELMVIEFVFLRMTHIKTPVCLTCSGTSISLTIDVGATINRRVINANHVTPTCLFYVHLPRRNVENIQSTGGVVVVG